MKTLTRAYWGYKMDVNININIDGNKVDVKQNDPELDIKKKYSKGGKSSVLRLPYNEGLYDKPSPILDMMGI